MRAHDVFDLTLSLLSLGEVAKTLLADLDGTLFLTDTEEFNDTLVELVEASDFTDDGLNSALALVGEGEAGVAGDGASAGGGLETGVDTSDETVVGGAGLGSLTVLGGHSFFC